MISLILFGNGQPNKIGKSSITVLAMFEIEKNKLSIEDSNFQIFENQASTKVQSPLEGSCLLYGSHGMDMAY